MTTEDLKQRTGRPAGTGRERRAWMRPFRSGPLALPSFRLYCAGQLTSTAGDYSYAVALPWLVLSNHGTPALLGTILACYGVARLLLVPAGGVLADRIGPRRVMLGADLLRCVVVAVFIVLAARHVSALAALGPVAALVGAGEGLFVPASFAIIPTLVEPGQLAAANGISDGIIQFGPLLGPVLGASLVATAGPAPALAVDAATFAVSALTLMLIRPRAVSAAAEDDSAPSEDAPAAFAATTMRDVLKSRVFQLILLLVLVSNAAGAGVLEVALPSLAHLRYGAGGYGALLAAVAAGMIVGTFVAATVKPGRPMLYVLLAYLANGAFCAVIPYLDGRTGAVIAALAYGACNGFAGVLALTVIQRWAPPSLMGTVMSLILLAAMGVFPLSAAVTGILVRHVGPAVFFPFAGLTIAVTMLIGLASRELRHLGSGRA